MWIDTYVALGGLAVALWEGPFADVAAADEGVLARGGGLEDAAEDFRLEGVEGGEGKDGEGGFEHGGRRDEWKGGEGFQR